MRRVVAATLLLFVSQISWADEHVLGDPLGSWELQHVINVYSKDNQGQIIL